MRLHNDYAQAFFTGDVGYGLEQIFRDDGGQTLQWLVEQQQTWVQLQRMAHRQHLLFTT